MSSIEEIIFHSLQRFDKADADDLQKNIYDYLSSNVIPGILGAAGKVSADNISLTYSQSLDRYTNNTSFDFISSNGKACTVPSGVSFDASGVRNYYTNYLSANGNLTGADVWYVWAKPDESEEALENREFFSPIDNATETREVLTRKITSGILVASRGVPDSDATWCRVGKFVFGFATINSILTLTGPTISAVTFTDFMSFGLQDTKVPGTKGMQVITYAIEEAMRKILSGGTEDLDGTPQTQPGSTPTMSLEGLIKYVKEQTYSKRGHIVLRFSPNPSWPSNTQVDFDDLTDVAPYLAPTVIEEHRLLGFDNVVVEHTYDKARFVIPFNPDYLQTLSNDYGITTNDMQDVSLMFTLENNDKAENSQNYFDPLQPDVTFFLGRSDASLPHRFVTMFGFNGPWSTTSDLDYNTNIGGTDYVGRSGIGIFSPLCRAYNPNLDTRGTPNHHELIVKEFIDYNNIIPGETNTTDVARYIEPPVFEVHLIVKG